MVTYQSTPTAALAAHLTPEQMQVAAWYFFDGFSQIDIAGWLGITQQAVAQRIKAIEETLARLGIPQPKRAEHPRRTRFVRHVAPSLLASL